MRPLTLYATILLFLLLRVAFLTSLPIVTDEAIYMHWGNRFLTFWNDARMPLSLHGKQAATLLTLGLAQLPPLDPLVAARISSIIFSVVALIATLWSAKQVLSPSSRILCIILLATSPLFLFFNRLALPDTAVAASYALAMALTLKLVKQPKFMTTILLGVVVAAGWWYKSTALLALPAILLTTLFVWLQKKHQTRLLLLTSLSIAVTLIFSLGIINLPSLNRVVPLEETQHVFTMTQLLSFPWPSWVDNMVKVFEAILLMSSPIAIIPIAIILLLSAGRLGVSSSVTALAQKTLWRKGKLDLDGARTTTNRPKRSLSLLIIAIWFLTPVLAEVLLARIFNLRYLILAVPPFTLLVANALDELKRFKQSLTILIIATSTVLSLYLITHPTGFYRLLAPLPHIQQDISQYITGWASGWGVKETAEYLKKEAKTGPIIVFVRPDGGNPESAMYVYLSHQRNVQVFSTMSLNEIMVQTQTIPEIRYYFVSRGKQYASLENRLTEVIRFPKPLDSEFVGIYELKVN